MPEKKGKMRKIANDGEGTMSEPIAEKKQRKKWTAEETQMLVDGCNTVSLTSWAKSRPFINRRLFSGVWATGKRSLKTQSLNSTIVLP